GFRQTCAFVRLDQIKNLADRIFGIRHWLPLLDVCFLIRRQRVRASGPWLPARTQLIFPVMANGSAFAAAFLRPLIGLLWHLVCQKRSCQGTAPDGSAENMGNLTFWH